MSKDFMNLDNEYKKIYEKTINEILENVSTDNTFNDTIRNLCKQALINNWDLTKKVNIVNIIIL